MTQTLVVPLSVTVTSHPLETTALAVFHEETIILLIILLTKDPGIMMILVAVLAQRNVLDIPMPSVGGPIPSARGNLTPRIRVQVDHRL